MRTSSRNRSHASRSKAESNEVMSGTNSPKGAFGGLHHLTAWFAQPLKLSFGFFRAFSGLGRFFRRLAGDFLASLNFGNEGLARLEARDVVLVDDERRVFRDVTGYFASTLFIYERAEAAHVNVIAFGHRILYYFKEGFNGRQDVGFLDAGFLRNFGNYLSFGHVGKGVLEVKKKLSGG